MIAVQGAVSEEGADRKMPPGVLLEGPVVDAKFLDSYIAFGIMVTGSIAALVWAFTQGIGWIEISVFVGTFVMSTIGIGFMHRYFVRDRHDGGAGLGAQMGLQPSPAPCSLRQARRRPQPLL